MKQFSLVRLEADRDAGKTGTREGAPTYPVDAEFWASARVVMPVAKASVHLRLDADVLDWFKAQGKGHLTRMNAVLRSFMEAHHAVDASIRSKAPKDQAWKGQPPGA